MFINYNNGKLTAYEFIVKSNSVETLRKIGLEGEKIGSTQYETLYEYDGQKFLNGNEKELIDNVKNDFPFTENIDEEDVNTVKGTVSYDKIKVPYLYNVIGGLIKKNVLSLEELIKIQNDEYNIDRQLLLKYKDEILDVIQIVEVKSEELEYLRELLRTIDSKPALAAEFIKREKIYTLDLEKSIFNK